MLGSGAILHEVIEAARWLAAHWQVRAQDFSVTSFSELARDGLACERARVFGDTTGASPFATRALTDSRGPIVAAPRMRARRA